MKNEVSHQGPINIQQQYKLASLTSTCSLLKNLSHFISCGWHYAAYILCLCNLIIFRRYMVIHVSCWKLFECLTLCIVLHIKTEYTLHNLHSVLLSCFHRLQKSCCDLQSSLLMKSTEQSYSSDHLIAKAKVIHQKINYPSNFPFCFLSTNCRCKTLNQRLSI